MRADQRLVLVVLSQKKDNEDLSKACFNQENVATASNNIIILARTDLRSSDAFVQDQIARFAPRSDAANFERVLKLYTAGTDAMNEEQIYHYAQLQCYLAMMQMTTAAMIKGVDSCMIGGFEKDKVDAFLRVNYPFQTAAILALGYRKAEPKYPKQRLRLDQVVEYR